MRHAILLFAAGLLVRLAHWLAAPDRSAASSPDYQGDAPYWQQLANGTASLESVLPFRPPAMGFLVSALWDGTSATILPRLVLVLLGAAIAPVLYLALRTAIDERIARTAAFLCALSQSLVVLGGGLHVEIPYLFVVVATLRDTERLRTAPTFAAAIRFGALHAVACLFRADHLLFPVALAAFLLWRTRGANARHLGLGLLAFGLVLAPWQMHVVRVIADFDEGRLGAPEPRLPPPGSMPWDGEAIAAVRALPPFTQAATAGFVADTVRVRGGSRVTAADLRVVEEAYGCMPEPLHTPLLALYGPLNFFLANCAESDGGFTRAALDRRPQLLGGLDRYPRGLLQVLPKELELGYPPHLEAVNHGYALGLEWIAENPTAAAHLFASKLQQAWRGAATGFGLTGVPMGRSGTREPVDFLVADGPLATGWRLAALALAAIGAFRLRREPALAPLLLWAVARAVVVVAFFGYARLGALAIPSLSVAWAAALVPMLDRIAARQRPMAWALLVAAVLADLSIAITHRRPEVVGGIGPHARVAVRY